MFLAQYRNTLLTNTTETPQNNYLAKTLVGKSSKQQPVKTNRAQIQARAQQIDNRKLAQRNCKKPCGEKRKPTTQLIQPSSKKNSGEKRETDKEKLKTNKNANNELNSKNPCGEKLRINKMRTETPAWGTGSSKPTRMPTMRWIAKNPVGNRSAPTKLKLKHQLGAQAGAQQLTMQTSAHGKAAKKTTHRGKITNNTDRRTRA